MKKIVLFCLAGIIAASQAFAQPCSITNVSVNIKSINLNPGSTTSGKVILDLSFTGNFNNGNKYAVIHLYPELAYPTTQVYPDRNATVTNAAAGTLVIKNAGEGDVTTVSYPTSFPTADLGALNSPFIVQAPGDFSASGPNTGRTFTFRNIQLSLNGLDDVVKVIADVYATQNLQNTNGGCVNLNAFNIIANEPLLRGLMVCGNPRTFNLSMSTIDTKDITVKAYRDVSPFGVFTAADEAEVLTLSYMGQSGTTLTINNEGTTPGTFNNYGPISYSPQPLGSIFGVWVAASPAGNTNVNRTLVENTCGILPVQFKSFTAARRNQQVVLKWETAMEMNNRGFQVQRNINGNWESIGFVATAAQDGNSSSLLAYNFTDNNNHPGVSQYRIMQIDFDGAVKYSEIRAVRGEEQIQKIMVYPNPSANGQVNLLFDGTASTRNIIVRDITGREIQYHRNVTANNFTISNLSTGMYQIQIIDLSTAAVATEKVIITKR